MSPRGRLLVFVPAVLAGLAIGVVAWQVLSSGPAFVTSEHVGERSTAPTGPEPEDLPDAEGPPGRRTDSGSRPEGPPPSLAEARTLLEVERPEDALDALDRILAAEPENREALLLRAKAYLSLPQMERSAENDLRRALRLGEPTADLLADLGAALARTRPREALGHLEKSIEMDGTRARPWALIARIHMVRGDRRRARHAVERALYLEPGNEIALAVQEAITPR